MHEIMKKTYELIDCLDESSIVKRLDNAKRRIDTNNELKDLILLGNYTEDEYALLDIKHRLYQYEEYKEYMHVYNELMYLVMDINSRYKKIIGKGKCFK